MPLSGTTGYVLVNGVPKTASKWTASLKQAVIDRANFTTAGEPINSAGQRTGTITLEGPYEDTVGIVLGNLYTFVLGFTPQLLVQVQARVSDFTPSNDCADAPRWSLTAEQFGPSIALL
jgi:hypothetical protein